MTTPDYLDDLPPASTEEDVRKRLNIRLSPWRKFVREGLVEILSVPGTNVRLVTVAAERMLLERLVALAKTDTALEKQKQKSEQKSRSAKIGLSSPRHGGRLRKLRSQAAGA